MRGPGQKIVGFSFYGDINTPKSKKKGINRKIFKVNGSMLYYKIAQHYNIISMLISGYFEGIVGNLELMPLYYPGWVMRLYYDLDDRDPITKVY